jgi:hypothetical protein
MWFIGIVTGSIFLARGAVGLVEGDFLRAFFGLVGLAICSKIAYEGLSVLESGLIITGRIVFPK